MDISITDLEQAINYWRAQCPSTGEEHALSPEVDKLATIYALMIFERVKVWPGDRADQAVLDLIEDWRTRQPR